MKTNRFPLRYRLILAGLLGSCAAWTQGTVIYTDEFDTDTSDQWSVFDSSASGVSDYTADFAHDYSAEGIPPAPNGSGDTTSGLKMTVNNGDDVAEQAVVNAYPNNGSRTGNHGLRVDMWLSYNGGAFGGSGSTEFALFGLNHTADKANWYDADFVIDSDGVWFAVTGDGGASRDYRAYEGFTFSPALEFLNDEGGFFDRDGDGLYEFEVNSTQLPTFPLKVFFPGPKFETAGMPSKNWVEVEVRSVNGELTWVIDGYVIARRFNLSGYESGTPMIGYMDVFTSIANPAEDNFVIYDNFRIVDYSTGDLPIELSVEALDPEAGEPGADTGSFLVSRFGGNSRALTVHYTVGGTAVPGEDYQELSGMVEIPAGMDSVEVAVIPLDDRGGEPDETVTLALAGMPGSYEVGPLFRAEVVIKDDGDTTGVSVVARDGHTYERMFDDEVVFQVVREGATDTDLTVNVSFGGTADAGVDYEGDVANVLIPVGEESVEVILNPRDDEEVEGEEIIEVTVEAGEDYAVGESASAIASLRDDDLPPAPVLFSDDFDTDTSSRWQLQFGANNEIEDYAAEFAYDYGWDGIPPAPGSVTTSGLRMRVNKFDAENSAAGLNAYLKDETFNGNFALRYHLYLSYSSSVGGTTEHSIAGLNHSGDVVNRHDTPGGDGLWFAMETDGSASGGRSYVSYVGNDTEVPAYDSLPADDFVDYFTSPPFLANGAVSGQWVDVEIAQIGARLTLTINGVEIISRENSAVSSGTVMIGHMDTYSSTGAEDANYSLIDNLRVVELEGPTEIVIDSITLADGQVVIEWTGSARLQSADSVSGEWTDVDGAMSPYSTTPDAPAKFYRLVQ